MSSIDFTSFLKLMAHKKASDLFITAGVPPSIKVQGKVSAITQSPLTPQQSREMVLNVMSPSQREEFEKTHECNFAIGAAGIGRFRVSCFYQRNQVGMVLRRIETKIPTIEELSLPVILKSLAMTKRGVIICVGATGTGKSTTLAAMIGYRNLNSTGHIITIEDPIEFVHKHEGCIITQREVGIDTDYLGKRPEEHPAPGAGCHHDRRGPHPRGHGPCHRVCRDRPLGVLYVARQQRQPGHRPHHQLLPRRAPQPAADGSVLEPEGDHRAAADSDPGRQGAPCRYGNSARYALGAGLHPRR